MISLHLAWALGLEASEAASFSPSSHVSLDAKPVVSAGTTGTRTPSLDGCTDSDPIPGRVHSQVGDTALQPLITCRLERGKSPRHRVGGGPEAGGAGEGFRRDGSEPGWKH